MTAAENQLEFDALALELLQEFGVTGTVTFESGGTYDPAESEVTGAITQTFPNVLHTPPIPADERYVPADILRETSAFVFMAKTGLGFDPEPVQKLTLTDGTAFRVLRVLEWRAGDAATFYTLFLSG